MPFGVVVDCCNEDVFHCIPNVVFFFYFELLVLQVFGYLKDGDSGSQAVVFLSSFPFF